MIPGYGVVLDDNTDWANAVPTSGRPFPLHTPAPRREQDLTEDERALRDLQEMNRRATFVFTYPLPEDDPRLMPPRRPKPVPKKTIVQTAKRELESVSTTRRQEPSRSSTNSLARDHHLALELAREEAERSTVSRSLRPAAAPLTPPPSGGLQHTVSDQVVHPAPSQTTSNGDMADVRVPERVDTPQRQQPPTPTMSTQPTGRQSRPTSAQRRTPATSGAQQQRGTGGSWELTDFSYEALLELGSMAVPTGLCKRQLARYRPVSYTGACPCTCPICLEDLCPGSPSLTVGCGHSFHPKCILDWLARSNRCPTCRHEVPRSKTL